jgi:hypothetical protein
LLDDPVFTKPKSDFIERLIAGWRQAKVKAEPQPMIQAAHCKACKRQYHRTFRWFS